LFDSITANQLIYSAVAVILAVAAVYLLIHIRRLPASRTTLGRVKRKLVSLCSSNSAFKQLTDVKITLGDKSLYVGHLFFTPWGITVIEDLQAPGNYYGELNSEQLVVSTSSDKGPGKRYYVNNPASECVNAVKLLRELLTANKIYNVQLDYYVVKGHKAEVFVPDSKDTFLTVKELGRQLDSAKYKKGKADVSAVSSMPGITSERRNAAKKQLI